MGQKDLALNISVFLQMLDKHFQWRNYFQCLMILLLLLEEQPVSLSMLSLGTSNQACLLERVHSK